MQEHIQARLQGASLDALLTLGIDYLLEQPISELVDQSLQFSMLIKGYNIDEHDEKYEHVA